MLWVGAPVLFLAVCAMAFAQPLLQNPEVTFADIDGHWAQGDIEELAGWGVITGMPDGSFAPEAPVTRAQVAVLLKRTVNLVGFQTIITRSFTNDTEQNVNDIHFDFSQATNVLDAGPFGDIGGNGTSTISLSNPLDSDGESTVIAPGETVVLKFGTSANSLRYKYWWWTKDGVMVGQKKGTGRSAPL